MTNLFKFTVEVEMESNLHQPDPDSDLVCPQVRIVIKQALRDHIKDAVESWGGQLWPGHVLFSQNFKRVNVRYVINRRRRVK